uniref:Calpain catalytic domain-containing protein n=1 Tax=Caenorhabditis tropicalis TaxID=1561998 RepID=A0A1I7TDS4_9PELO
MSDEEEYYEEDENQDDGGGDDGYEYEQDDNNGGGYDGQYDQNQGYDQQNYGDYGDQYGGQQQDYGNQPQNYGDQYGGGYNQEYQQGDYQGGYDDANQYEEPEEEEEEEDEVEPEPEEHPEYEQSEEEEEEDDGYTQVEAHTNQASDGTEGGNNESHGLGSMIKGAMDGFGGGGFDGVVGQIGSLISQGGGGGGGLTNVFSSGGMESIVGNLISSASHQFFGINPATGAIIGAIAGNIIFQMGGQNNSLSSIGKVVLDNIISGKFKRDIHPFTPGGTVPGLGFQQQFQTINFQQERQRCLDQRILFEDPQFPANDSSLYYKTRPDEPIVWKRPGEIYENPQLIVGEKSRFDVKQGALGDCWLLAAVANLTLRDELFYRVVPPDQSFTENYAGIFHFQFWRYGQWVDVVIDDRLPTVDGRLCYMRSQENNEFWSALLEKAYAKLYGGYENLDGGTTAEALEDFTGGLTEFFDLEKADKATTLAMLVRGMQMGSLFGCSIDADENVKEAQLTNGLVRGHAYSITAIQTVNTYGGQIPLLRIRNPWGNSKEWNGPWSDGSGEWNQVDPHQKEQMGVQFAKDGEFWMSFDDFMTNFTQMECCNLSADVMNEISEMTGVEVHDKQQHQWVEKQEDGEWNSRQGTAGGCQNNETYCQNPQYGTTFQVPYDSIEQDGKCTVIVAVLQKYRRELRSKNLDNLPIGFSVYRIEGGGALTDTSGKKPVARTRVFINMREVTVRFRVPPGQYIVVPCTFDAYDDASFLLRVFSNAEFQTSRLR